MRSKWETELELYQRSPEMKHLSNIYWVPYIVLSIVNSKGRISFLKEAYARGEGQGGKKNGENVTKRVKTYAP